MGIFFRSFACLIFSFVTTLICFVQAIDGDPSMVVAPDLIPTGGTLKSPHGRYLLAMQFDCNLVLYDLGKNQLPVWATNTSGHGANCFAAMESNGNFVLYDGAHLIKFQTLTFIYSCTGNYLAWLQDDGNFVVYCAPLVGNCRGSRLFGLLAPMAGEPSLASIECLGWLQFVHGHSVLEEEGLRRVTAAHNPWLSLHSRFPAVIKP